MHLTSIMVAMAIAKPSRPTADAYHGAILCVHQIVLSPSGRGTRKRLSREHHVAIHIRTHTYTQTQAHATPIRINTYAYNFLLLSFSIQPLIDPATYPDRKTTNWNSSEDVELSRCMMKRQADPGWSGDRHCGSSSRTSRMSREGHFRPRRPRLQWCVSRGRVRW